MELKLYIKQKEITDKYGNKRYLSGRLPNLIYQNGTLPPGRQFPNYGKYLDVTNDVSNLHKLKLTWTLDKDTNGLTIAGATNQKKAASGTLTFEGEAYKRIKQWLVNDDSAPLNELDVRIEDSCGSYEGWVLKATDLTWCEGDICTLDASLKQRDEPLTCIKNTLIADDHLGWFGETTRPKSGKKHPRFSYCNEIRPNALLVTLWWTMTQLMSIMGPLMLVIAPVVNSIVFTLKTIIYPIINLILGILGKKKLDKDKLNYINYKDVKEIFGNFFIESAGCGREHPAPLIRDYIRNVCSKCNIDVDADSAPIFFAQQVLIETSTDRYSGRAAQYRENPHFNACYFYAPIDKGVRRFDDLNIFNGASKNTTDWWLPGNAPLLTLDMFLDELKTIYNAEWRVEQNKLYFKRKDYWLDDNNQFDFSEKGKSRQLLLEGICYEWDERKDPVYGKGIYTADAADVCGNNAMKFMNGYVSFGDISVNPVLDGVLDKSTTFGATKFRLDGASADYVYDAMQQVINTTLITGSVWTTPLFSTVNGFFLDYANYALLLKQETATLPKILIWDTKSYENAKCVTPYHASVSLQKPAPVPNVKYNQGKRLWEHTHELETKIYGRKLVPPPQPVGIYEVRGLFGLLVTAQAAKLVNYPMYFEPGYENTLWDWFHFIDDPDFNPNRHMKFTAKMDLCCDTADRLSVYGLSDQSILGQKVKLPGGYPDEGRIKEIEISYDVSETIGPYIQLKGTV